MENLNHYLFFVVVTGILSLLLIKKVNTLKQKDLRDLLNLKEKARFKKFSNYIDIYNAISTESKFQDNNEILEDFFSRQIFYIQSIKRFWRNDIIRLHTSDFKKRSSYNVKFKCVGLFGGLNYFKIFFED